jgi:hypothetical protein
MRCSIVLALAVLTALVVGENRASAQPRPGIGAPPVTQTPYSPYLNLLRGGSITQNYWGLVQPELQWRGYVQGLDQQVAANSQAIGSLQAQMLGPPASGHATRFLNTGGYFLRSGGGMGGAARGGR